jgi:hypothetical protein
MDVVMDVNSDVNFEERASVLALVFVVWMDAISVVTKDVVMVNVAPLG